MKKLIITLLASSLFSNCLGMEKKEISKKQIIGAFAYKYTIKDESTKNIYAISNKLINFNGGNNQANSMSLYKLKNGKKILEYVTGSVTVGYNPFNDLNPNILLYNGFRSPRLLVNASTKELKFFKKNKFMECCNGKKAIISKEKSEQRPTISLYNTETKETKNIDFSGEQPTEIEVTMSPNGKFVVFDNTSISTRQYHIYDLEKEKIIAAYKVNHEKQNDFSMQGDLNNTFTPDSLYVCFGTENMHTKNMLMAINLNNGSIKTKKINGVAKDFYLTPDGKVCFNYDQNDLGTFYFWNIIKNEITTIKLNTRSIYPLYSHELKNYVLYRLKNEIALYDTNLGKCLLKDPLGSYQYFSSPHHFIVSGRKDSNSQKKIGFAKLYDLNKKKFIASLEFSTLLKAGTTNDGKYFFAYTSELVRNGPYSIKIMRINDGQIIKTSTIKPFRNNHLPEGDQEKVERAHDNAIIFQNNEQEVTIYNCQNDTTTLINFDEEIISFALTPDQKHLAVSSQKTTKIYEWLSEEQTYKIKNEE